MTDRIYVGNLGPDSTEEEILDLFAQKQVPVKEFKIARDLSRDRSRGFGFAQVEGEEEIRMAIERLDGTTLRNGRDLRVSQAHPVRERHGGFGKGEGAAGIYNLDSVRPRRRRR